MSRLRQGIGFAAELFRLVAVAVLAATVLFGLCLLPDLVRFVPPWISQNAVKLTSLVLLGVYGIARILAQFGRGNAGRMEALAQRVDRFDAVCRTLLGRPFVVAFAGTSILWLFTWLPNYLYWPWCRDTDTYALMAQEWDCGVLPYRDIRAFNFPGHIYLHWILGKLFGWGYTALFYALDAAALLLLGVVVVAWSRRSLGLALPGIVSYLIFLAYYLTIDFQSVAERDWHCALLSTVGVLLLQAWPGRPSRWLSALLAAVALTIRPQVVLFVPALLAAAASGDMATRGGLSTGSDFPGPKRAILQALEWVCAFGFFAVIGFAPLMASGLMDDLIRGLQLVRPDGPISDATAVRRIGVLREQLREPRTYALVFGLLSLAAGSRNVTLKTMARIWLMALAAALAYRSIHPRDHAYLRTPLALVGAVAWAIPIAWIVRAATEERRVRLGSFPAAIGILLIVYAAMPQIVPPNCSLRATISSIKAAARGGWPAVPLGASTIFDIRRTRYTWDGYCRLLKYVRENTGPETVVANVLRCPPFPAVNGPTGRRSPFRVESGIAWMWVVAEDLDETFAAELERLGRDSIVVWSPGDDAAVVKLTLKRLTTVISERYVFEARFDNFEVWRRR